jgi:hypothetical protein
MDNGIQGGPMEKRIFLALLISFPLLAFPQDGPIHAFYALPSAGSTYSIFERVANLREGPSTDSKVVRQLTLGESVKVLSISPAIQEIDGMSAHWLQVDHEGATGFVWGGLIASLKADDELAGDYDGDGKQEYLLARAKTTGDREYLGYLANNIFEFRLMDDGVLLSDSPFDELPPMADSSFTVLGDRGFKPPLRILEVAQNFNDAEYGYEHHTYYYYKDKRFHIIFDYTDDSDQGYSQKSTVLFPANGKKNAIEYSKREIRTDPVTGKAISDSIVERRRFVYDGAKFTEE